MPKSFACLTLLAVLSAAPSATGPAGGESQRTLASLPAPAAAISDAPESPAAAFRLGTAARPFGWSTVISDFNGDGAPDVAVADRGQPQSGVFGYNLRVAVSGLKLRDIAFVSPHAAVTVRAMDVDQDHDVDLVISAVPSGELIAVWLNDGRGRFTEGSLSQIPAQLSPDGRLDQGDAGDGTHITAEGPRRIDDVLAPPRARAPSSHKRALPLTESPRRHTRGASPSTGPRAPPTATPSIPA